MRKNRFVELFFLLFMFVPAFAQISLSVSEIPEILKKGANSVVRKNEVFFTAQSSQGGILHEVLIVTVLSEKGNDAGGFSYYEDMFRELRSFSGEMYDTSGKLIRKIKRSELKYTELMDGLASDDRIYFYEPISPVYPYTIKYEFEAKYKRGIITYPRFFPQKDYNQTVESASYQLLLQNDADLKYKAFNMEAEPRKTTDKKGVLWEWSVSDMPALERERFAPPIRTLIPHILASPVRFVYADHPGDLTDWKSFGLWQYDLLRNRDVLPEALKQEIIKLTATAGNDKEKVRIIYDLLARTTRYVSIQLGIGGLQPISAAEVAKNHFGDCKGLSNYMKAMLQAVGIPSCYTVISTENARLIPDFSGAQQMNHVILQVPLPGDTLWLECTNPQLPFGYVHGSIAGHDALLIKETGGEVYRLPTYPDSLNRESYCTEIILDESGKASAKVKRTASLRQYEHLFGYGQQSAREQTDFLRGELSLAQAVVENGAWTENKEAPPSVTVSFDLTSDRYGTRTGNRLFIPVNVFRRGFSALNEKERVHDICVESGYMDSDSLRIRIPDNYEIEAIPRSVSLNSAFGEFESSVRVVENEIIINQRLLFSTGTYKASEYPLFILFCKGLTSAYRENVILRKKNAGKE